MTARSILGLGELLWDELPGARRLGGAPANVAHHATVLGDRGAVATRVGADPAGAEAVALLSARGVDTSLVQRDPRRPTGTARVAVVGREVSFSIDDAAAWAVPAWTDAWERAAGEADAICFGTLIAVRAEGRSVLERAARAGAGALRLLDLNLRPPLDGGDAIESALACANALKVSEDEEALLCERLGVADLADWALGTAGYRALAVTRGARGCSLFTSAGRTDQPGVATTATGGGDPVGAGDAFAGALLHHLVRDRAPERASAAANRYAAFVASRVGAMPEVPASVISEVTGGRPAEAPRGA